MKKILDFSWVYCVSYYRKLSKKLFGWSITQNQVPRMTFTKGDKPSACVPIHADNGVLIVQAVSSTKRLSYAGWYFNWAPVEI